MTGLTRQQHDVLLLPIKAHRVRTKDGQSNVEAYDIRAHLNRVFGFAQWSEDTLDLVMLYEQSKEEANGPRWRAAYRATVRLTILATGATYTESAAGTNFGWLPDSKRDDTHDMAMKTATSQALKRCAINLGDQFGLSLYNGGSLAPLVGQSLVIPGPTDPFQAAPSAPIDEHITEQLAPEDSPAGPAEEAPVSAAPARQADDPVDEVRAEALAATKKADLMRLLMRCGKEQIGGAMTTDGDGKGLTLETLINARLKALAA